MATLQNSAICMGSIRDKNVMLTRHWAAWSEIMLEKIINIIRKNSFNIHIGKVYEGSSGITANFYFTNSIKKVPNKNFIGLPNYTFRLLIYTVRLLKENKEREVRIFDGEYVLLLYRKDGDIYVYYQWKYCINKVSDNWIEWKNRPTKKRLFYKGKYIDFLKIIYDIALRLQKKFEKYGICSDAEMELYQQIPVLEKYIKKLEKIS